LLEIFNPDQSTIILGIVGFRAYWLWWLAPMVIASAIRTAEERQKVLVALAFTALIVGAFAAYQFSQPASSEVNGYATYNGQVITDVATVASTGRARVSSTFGYISGFTDFVILIPSLLLSFGLNEAKNRTRIICLAAVVVSVATVPMSGSRSPILIGGGVLLIVARQAGLLRSKVGRRMIVGGAIAAFLALSFSPDAVQGVEDRFKGEDTETRLLGIAELFPPYAVTALDYPVLGIGTGMQQNARFTLGLTQDRWNAEGEVGRFLIELGAPGYLAFWVARVGLALLLWRAGQMAKRLKQPAIAGAAFGYVPLTFMGNIVFDHIYQALYFVGVGLILQSISGPSTVGRPGLSGSKFPR
jgi:hypothetical protein